MRDLHRLVEEGHVNVIREGDAAGDHPAYGSRMDSHGIRGAIQPILDWLIALGLALLGLLDIMTNSTGFQGPRGANVVFVLSISLPLAWRRRVPAEVLCAVSGATVLSFFAMYDLSREPPVEPFLALLVAFYSAAMYGRGGRALILGTVGAAVIAAEEIAALVAGRPWGDVIPAVIFWTAAGVLGSALRRRQDIASALERRTSELEMGQEEAARAAVAEERTRIARELHDVIAHGLSVVVIQAEAERRTLPRGQASTREVLATIEKTARESLIELRRLLGMIRKSEAEMTLRPQPSLSELDALVEKIQAAGVEVELRTEGEVTSLAPGIDLSAYRIVQEGLTNVLKHAHGARSQVTIRYRPRALEVEIKDDGSGATGPTEGGHGLIGIRERIEIYGGRLETGPGPTGGFRLWAQLPLDRAL